MWSRLMGLLRIGPWLPWLGAVLLGAVFGAGWSVGQQIGSAQGAREAAAAEAACAARVEAHLRRLIVQSTEQARMDATILRDAAQQAEAARIQTRDVTREVIRHVSTDPDYRTCVLDPRGLCLARAAAHGSDPSDCPGDAADAVRTPPSAAGRDDG